MAAYNGGVNLAAAHQQSAASLSMAASISASKIWHQPMAHQLAAKANKRRKYNTANLISAMAAGGNLASA
jgi:hypothetical protein